MKETEKKKDMPAAAAAPREEERIRRVTYGVNGLMEWRMLLPTGYAVRPFIEVAFEGGQITGYGVSPARFTTEDPFLQKLIERSPNFKSRLIYIVKEEK